MFADESERKDFAYTILGKQGSKLFSVFKSLIVFVYTLI